MAPEPHTATPASAGRMAPTGTQRGARLPPAPCARGAEGHPGRGRAGRPSGRPLGRGGGGAGTGGGGGASEGAAGLVPSPAPAHQNTWSLVTRSCRSVHFFPRSDDT